ncbi:MAG: hypothetical protein K2J62_07500, partial [Bacteroidales bacterium]|nr:hypothetical protein [Bacteroidales bacterium]
HQTTHKKLYFNYLYVLLPTTFGIITPFYETGRIDAVIRKVGSPAKACVYHVFLWIPSKTLCL